MHLGGATSSSVTTPTAPLSSQRAAITTDTGDFALGRTSFTRYTTPGFCLVAVRNAIDVTRRSIVAQEALDQVRQDPVHDTLPAVVAPIARACATRFPVATTPAADLPDLFVLALLGQQDTLAQAVLTRQLTLAKEPRTRASVLVDAVRILLAAAPARVSTAEALARRVDALGAADVVLPSRFQAHERLLQLGDSTADWTRVQTEADAILALARSLSVARRRQYLEYTDRAYQALMRIAYLRAPDSMPSIARQVQQYVTQLTDLSRSPRTALDSMLHRYATLSVDSVVRRLSPVGMWAELGQPTPSLHADFWIPAKDTVLPVSGRVSLFVELSGACYDSYVTAAVLDPISSGCERMYNMIRAWRARYGADLDLTLVAWTTSFGGTVLSGPQTPAEAAKTLQWYFLEYLKLPVNHIAVQIIPLAAPLPAPDGRIFALSPYEGWSFNQLMATPFQRVYHADAYKSSGDAALVLTGRDGRYLYGGGPSVVFDQLLARAMVAPAVATPPGRVPPPASAALSHPQPGT